MSPIKMTERVLRIHTTGSNHKMNIPASFYTSIGHDEVPSILVEVEGEPPVVIMNLPAAAIGKWIDAAARDLVMAPGSWSGDRTGALRQRLRVAGGDSLLLLDDIVIDAARKVARAGIVPPVDEGKVEQLKVMAARLGLAWSLPLDEARPVVELAPAPGQAGDDAMTRSIAEEAQLGALTGTTLPDMPGPEVGAELETFTRAFLQDFIAYQVKVEAVAKANGIPVRWDGTLPRFSWKGRPHLQFPAFKHAHVASLPAATWIELEQAFRSSTTGYELGMVSCISFRPCVDGWRFERVVVPADEIDARKKVEGIVPLALLPDMRVLSDQIMAEIERAKGIDTRARYWVKGYPPPAFLDRYGEVPPLHCAGCGGDITDTAYGAPTFVKAVSCPSCGAKLDVTFGRGEYSVVGLHREKKANR